MLHKILVGKRSLFGLHNQLFWRINFHIIPQLTTFMTFDYIISFHEYQRSQNSTQIDTSVIVLQYKMYTMDVLNFYVDFH